MTQKGWTSVSAPRLRPMIGYLNETGLSHTNSPPTEDDMADPAKAHDAISTAQLAATVELACRAPSLHNSQPWRWIFQNGTLHLFADHARVGRHTDATGRELILSCGAALDHLLVAAATTGWQVTVERYPNPHDHDHLASAVFTGQSPRASTPISWAKRSRAGARIGWRSRHLSRGLRWNSNCARSSVARSPTRT